MENTKKQVSEFILQQGGTSAYSGKQKTMFINGEGIELLVIQKFGYGLAFKLSNNP